MKFEVVLATRENSVIPVGEEIARPLGKCEMFFIRVCVPKEASAAFSNFAVTQ